MGGREGGGEGRIGLGLDEGGEGEVVPLLPGPQAMRMDLPFEGGWTL